MDILEVRGTPVPGSGFGEVCAACLGSSICGNEPRLNVSAKLAIPEKASVVHPLFFTIIPHASSNRPATDLPKDMFEHL